MAKLLTPFGYENKLAGLSESLPLALQDEGRQIIDLPLADLQPAGGKCPAVGKFLRCNQQGALLQKCTEQHFENVEHIASGDITGNVLQLAEFSQKVYKVVVFCTYTMLGCFVDWATPDGTLIKALSFGISKQCDFVGTKFYYQTRVYIMGVITFDFYGLY